MRLSVKKRLWGAKRRASRARTLAKPGSKLNRATNGEAGPTRGPGGAAGPRRQQPASRAQRDSHANRARLRREEEPREAELGNDGDLAQGVSEHDRAERLLRRRVLLQKQQDFRPEPASTTNGVSSACGFFSGGYRFSENEFREVNKKLKQIRS